MKIKSHIVNIGVGILNLIHGLFHLIQFFQSLILINETHEHHSIWFSILWASVGLTSLIIGIRDYIHHTKCKTV